MFQLVLTLLTTSTAHGNCCASSVPNFLRYYPGEFLKLLTESKALIEGTSRTAITKEVRVRMRHRPSSRPLRGDSLLQRGTVCYVANCPGAGGTLYYVVNCPGGTLLRSKVSGGHFTTGDRLLRDRTAPAERCSYSCGHSLRPQIATVALEVALYPGMTCEGPYTPCDGLHVPSAGPYTRHFTPGYSATSRATVDCQYFRTVVASAGRPGHFCILGQVWPGRPFQPADWRRARHPHVVKGRQSGVWRKARQGRGRGKDLPG